MLRIAICDDEQYFLELLRSALEEYFQTKDTAREYFYYKDGLSLIEAASSGPPFALIFLDIEMAGMDGIEAARAIQAYAPETIVIFITAHHEYVRQAIALGAFQYLEKPLDKAVLMEELDRAMAWYRHKHFRYALTWNGEEYLIALKDIYYFETRQRITVLEGKQSYCQNKKLDLIENQLKNFDFLRIHQSYLINMALVAGFRKHEIRLLTPDKEVWLPVSRHRLKAVKEAYVAYRNRVGI